MSNLLSGPYSYSCWHRRSTIKERVRRIFQRHRGHSIEAKIRHLWVFSFKSNNTKWSVPIKEVRIKSALENFMPWEKQQHYGSREYYCCLCHPNGSKFHLNLKDRKAFTEKFEIAVSYISHGQFYYRVLKKLMV